MLKHFFIILCFLSLVLVHISSCGPSKRELEDIAKAKDKTYHTTIQFEETDSLEYSDIEIRIIDSCEYVIYRKIEYGTISSGICPKHNCKNPIHKTNK